MIDKQEFYRGAAVLRMIHDGRAASLRPYGCGYLVNDRAFVLVKYSTKTSSPWRFAFTPIELAAIDAERSARLVVLALVCGGDGICAIAWGSVETVLGKGRQSMSCRRRFNGRYVVSGALGDVPRRIPHNQWPGIVFSEETG